MKRWLLWAWYMEAEGGSYVILISFQAAEVWLDKNLLEIWDKKIVFQATSSKPSLSRALCPSKTDEKFNREDK